MFRRGTLTMAFFFLLLPNSDCLLARVQGQRFRRAVEYWTETLCTLQKTKTFVFHGFFVNGTRTLRDFYDVLLRTTAEYCGGVVLVKVYTLPNIDRDRGWTRPKDSNSSEKADTNKNWNGNNTGPRASGRREAIWRSVSMVDLLDHKWNVERNWRRHDEYLIDVWTVNVIFLGDSESFARLLDSPGDRFRWNSREHFIVLAVWNDPLAALNDRRPLIDNTLRKLWTNYRIHSVFFHEPLSGADSPTLYSYNPFAVHGENAWGQLEIVDGSSKRRMLRLLSTMTYERTVNFNGYLFNVSFFDQWARELKIQGNIDLRSIDPYTNGYVGPSGILLSVLARKLNFTANLIVPNVSEKYGHQLKDGTFSGAIGDVTYHRVVASFDLFFVKKYVDDTSSLEFTATTDFDQVCVIVPKASKIPKSLRMFYIFESNVWLCLIASYVLIYLTWYYMQLLSPLRPRRTRKQTLVRIIYVCTGYPVSLPSAISERLILLGLFFCSTTLMGIYNGILYKSFATDMFYKDIDTLAELDASRLPVGFYSYSMRDIFGTRDDPSLSPVLKRLQSRMFRIAHSVNAVAYHRNTSTLIRDQSFSLLRQTYTDKHGTPLLHRVNECPGRFYLACLLPGNSFLRERINFMIGRLNQAGLPTLWRTRSILRYVGNLRKRDEVKSHRQLFVAFQLSDIQISLYILAAGLSWSVLLFFTEMGWLSFPFERKRNHFLP